MTPTTPHFPIKGPPELPGLIAASVWIISRPSAISCAVILRLARSTTLEIMPALKLGGPAVKLLLGYPYAYTSSVVDKLH